jgi:hypothetical protein
MARDELHSDVLQAVVAKTSRYDKDRL